MSCVRGAGRLGNQIIRTKAISLLVEKYDLDITYENYETIHERLGINLPIGKKIYSSDIEVRQENYRNYLENVETISSNIQATHYWSFYQQPWILNLVYRKLNSERDGVIAKNPFRDRYKNNNDLFIHARLGGVAKGIPPLSYFENCIGRVSFDKLYIGSDSFKHPIIEDICKKYPEKVILLEKDPVETIQFASTCKNIVLTQGTFSGVIGCLSFFSENIFYPEEQIFQYCRHEIVARDSWTAVPLK